MSELIERLRVILAGIDETECDSENGWWETSTGADLGDRKLAEVEALFTTLQAELAEANENINLKADFIDATLNDLAAQSQELAEAREVTAKLRADLNRCFRGETHSVRNERVLAKIGAYTSTTIEAHDWSKP